MQTQRTKVAAPVTCRRCDEPAQAHCPGCDICLPGDMEHPAWCEATPAQIRRAVRVADRWHAERGE